MLLFRVPQLAQSKVVETHVHAMILLYIKQRAAQRQEQEDVHRRRQRAVSVALARRGPGEEEGESVSGERGERKVMRVGLGPADSCRLCPPPPHQQQPAQAGGERRFGFEGHETEAKLSEEQI
eukprot:1805046-Rhodomonas_salina.1